MSWKIVLFQVLILILYFASLLAQEGEYKFSNKDADYIIVNDMVKIGQDKKRFEITEPVWFKSSLGHDRSANIPKIKTWPDAMRYCKDQKKMQLVSFETQAKIVKFLIYLYKRDFLQSKKVHPNSTVVFAYWTSGNNLDDPQQFIWETANRPLEYFHWLNKVEEVPGGKGCILMGLKTFGRWTNASCDTPNLFICESPH